jgi:hypothetical protein
MRTTTIVIWKSNAIDSPAYRLRDRALSSSLPAALGELITKALELQKEVLSYFAF